MRVENLTPPASLRSGLIYTLVGEDDAPASRLLWSLLLDACASGETACLISPPGIEHHLAQSGLQGLALTAIAAGTLAVQEVSLPARHGENTPHAQRMIDDLQHQKRQDALLVIQGVEALFPALDEDTLHLWRAWAEQHDAAVVLMLRADAQTREGREALVALAPLAHLFAGLAQIKSRYGVSSLEIFHWFNAEGMMASQTLPLHCLADGRLATDAADAHADQGAAADANAATPIAGPAAMPTVAPAADEAQIVTLKTTFLPREKAPDWYIVDDDDPGSLLELAAGAVAATFIIPFTASSHFDRVGRCIFNLRKQCGPRLKILVREVGSRLRYSQETLAVRLGANLVVPAEISYARFLSLTSMVQGQWFPHSLPSSYEVALKDAAPEQDQGYLPPAGFVRSVRNALAQSRVLHIQVALVRLSLANGLLPLDALRYCKVKRAGDIFTSDTASVYVFLYACREGDVDITLDRLFALPVSELFASDDRLLSARTIEEAVRDFEVRRAEGSFPDLTADLAAIEQARMPSSPAQHKEPPKEGLRAVHPVQQQPKAPDRYAAPPLAVQRPLALAAS